MTKRKPVVDWASKANTKTKKRRRPSKKLVTTLESLAAALPDDDAGEEEHVTQDAKIRHKSLRSRPGAMKRKEKLEKMERDRFSKNMVQMAQGAGRPSVLTADSLPVSQTANRWAALRGFISQTMEQKAEFRIQ